MKKIIALILIIGLGVMGFFYRDMLFPNLGKKELQISLNTEATDLSAYGLDLNNSIRTANIYQGLVAFDKDLRVVPGLAVSWGNITDTTWEFRLRQGVSFHDGSFFVAQDVINAFENGKKSNHPNLLPYLNSIKEIQVVGTDKILIETTAPDPLLLSKLTKLYIHKGDKIGTGPYRFKQWVPGQRVELEAFSDYWGSKPYFSKVSYVVQLNRADRERSYEEGQTGILAAVSPDHALTLPREQIKRAYGLEVSFLMFKLNDPIFSQKKIREAVQKLIDPKKIEAIGNYFVKPASQFVPSGVFGFNRDIAVTNYNPDEEPRNLFGIKLERVDFDYPETYQTLGEYLGSQLQKAGFSVNNKPQHPEELLKKIIENSSQLFLIGWQFEDGDAGGFFDAFIHSEGVFNRGRYKNFEIDQLIEKSRTEMNPRTRLILLKEIGLKLQDDLIGLPLFEPSRLYAVQANINWEPRLDGLILAAEISR